MSRRRTQQSEPGPFIRMSYAEFLRRAEARKGAKRCWGDASVDENAEWSGAESLGDALRLANEGWKDGREAAGIAIENLERAAEGTPVWQHEIGGEFPDVAAYLAGEQECMLYREHAGNDAPRVRLVLPAACSWTITADEQLAYAATLAALMRSLAAQGVSVSYATMQTAAKRGGGRAVYGIGVEVLAYGEAMDIDRIAFTAHPAYFRRIGFAVKEQLEELAWAAREGYGHPAKEDDYETVEKIWGRDELENTVLLPMADDVAELLKKDDIDGLLRMFEQSIQTRATGGGATRRRDGEAPADWKDWPEPNEAARREGDREDRPQCDGEREHLASEDGSQPHDEQSIAVEDGDAKPGEIDEFRDDATETGPNAAEPGLEFSEDGSGGPRGSGPPGEDGDGVSTRWMSLLIAALLLGALGAAFFL